MPTDAGVGQVHRDLRVLHPSSGAGVLPLHAHTGRALLDVASLIDHQDRPWVAEMLHHIGAQVIAHPVVIPRRTRKQMLQSIRAGIADVLGDRPAVLPRQI